MRRVLIVAVIVLFAECQGRVPIAPAPPNQPPVAKIVGPGIAPEGTPVRFKTDGTTDLDGDSLTYTWLFGDGAKATTAESAIDHPYRNNGSYVVTLIVVDARGGADTAAASITIANVAPQLTVLSFPDTAVASAGPVQFEVRYTDPGADDTVQGMISWTLPGGNSEGRGLVGPGFVLHSFFDPGEYTVMVYLRDSDGAGTERYAAHTIHVVGP